MKHRKVLDFIIYPDKKLTNDDNGHKLEENTFTEEVKCNKCNMFKNPSWTCKESNCKLNYHICD